MAPRAGVMVGMNRIASGKKLSGFEFFRIEQREDGVYYVSSPGGQPPTPFKLKECGPTRVVCAGPLCFPISSGCHQERRGPEDCIDVITIIKQSRPKS